MSIVNKVLGLFLGNKYERDLSEVEPFVGKIREESVKLASLSNDQLRDLTATLKKEITGVILPGGGGDPRSENHS